MGLSRVLVYKYFNFYLFDFLLFCSFNRLDSLTQNRAINKVTYLSDGYNNNVDAISYNAEK